MHLFCLLSLWKLREFTFWKLLEYCSHQRDIFDMLLFRTTIRRVIQEYSMNQLNQCLMESQAWSMSKAHRCDQFWCSPPCVGRASYQALDMAWLQDPSRWTDCRMTDGGLHAHVHTDKSNVTPAKVLNVNAHAHTRTRTHTDTDTDTDTDTHTHTSKDTNK